MKYQEYYASPLGSILLTADDEGLTGLWFEGAGTEGNRDGAKPELIGSEYIENAKKWLDLYFSGRDPGFTPKLHLTGSDFRIRVGQIMLGIPYGETTTYKAIADQIAKERGMARMSAQAVGGAVGNNPISLIVPCHRVIGSDGSLTGYGGGLDRKRALRHLEGSCKQRSGLRSTFEF